MGMNEVISIKYGILFLGEKSFIRGIKFEIYWASNSIPAAKSQNFVNISWGQKPTCSKFFEFDFFYLKTFFSGRGTLSRFCSFASDRLFIFLGIIVLQDMMQVN